MPRHQPEKADRFRALHEGDPFVIPNPWDAGSARILEALGFQALATTSGGFALTLGRLDGEVSLDEVVEHVRELDRVSRLPVSVDLENGYGAAPDDAARAIAAAAAAGAVGGSIEDWDREAGIYEPALATERVAAAAAAARALDFPFTFTARAENHLRGKPDLDDTIARLNAYAEAGADVLYAPGLRNGEEIRTVVEATSRPVNVLAHPGLTLSEIVEAGAQRISVGSQLAWVAYGAMARAVEEMRETGRFAAFAQRPPPKEWLAAPSPSAVERIEATARWDDLPPLPEDAVAELRAVAAAARRAQRGQLAILAGPRAERRLAAEVVAAEARRELYRIDLAAVTSKYIGETEKRLDLALTRAESRDVVLLLDEGDALLGERTEVADAHERYADLEIDYLLRRLRERPSLVILAVEDPLLVDEELRRRIRHLVRLV